MGTFEKVRDILNEVLGADIEKITSNSRLTTDLGADSLDEIDLTMALEEEFAIEITDDVAEAHQDKTVGEIVASIDALTSAVRP